MTRFAHCFFCDDIRQEVGNKSTYVGIYNGELYLPMTPMVLAKLCIASFASTPANQPIKSLSMRIERDDAVVGQIDVPPAELAKLTEAAISTGNDGEPVERYSVGVNTMQVPFGIQHPCMIKVTMIADGVEHVAGRLRIKVSAQEAG